MTALENVQIPMFEGTLDRRARVRKAEELLAWSGCPIGCKHVPQKFSVGERQRVAIARALRTIRCCCWRTSRPATSTRAAGAGVLDLFDRLHRERA